MGAILHDHERGSMEVYPEQDIYSYLRRMREQEGLSLGELAERMDVRESFLEMLEDGELGRKLGPGYVRSIVVRYGACLGLDSDELLDAVQRQLSGEPAVLSALSRGVTPVQEPERATKRPEDVWSAPDEGRAVPEPGRTPEPEDAPAAPAQSPVEAAAVEASPVPDSGSDVLGLRPATSAPPAAPRGTRRAERHLYKTDRRSNVGLKVLRTTAVVLLLVGLAAVTVLAGVWVGTNLLGGDDATSAPAEAPETGEPAEAGASVTTVAGAESQESTPESTAIPSEEASGGSPAAVSTLPAAGDAGDEEEPGGTAAATPAAGYAATFEAIDEVWFEVIDQETDEVLFSGIKQAGETLRVEAEGPLLFSTGRPQSLRLNVDGSRVGTPDAFRWLITADGVSTRD